jgi:hypothetical protein
MSVAQRFESLFRTALDRKTVERGVKAEEKAFGELIVFCRHLATRQQIDVCVERYLTIYRDYRPAAVREGRPAPKLMDLPPIERNAERKSLTVLAILLKRRISEFKDGAALLERLRDDAIPRSELKERFDQLEEPDRSAILALVPAKPTGMLDVLRDAHRKAGGGKDPTIEKLWAVNPVHNASLKGEYDERVKACREAWAAANTALATPKQDNVALLEKSIDAFDHFVRSQKARRREPELFQILKWSRDALAVGDPLDEALYLQVVIVIYMLARQTKATSRLGLTPDEQIFLVAPLRGTRSTPPRYAAMHAARFKAFAPAPNDFTSLNRYHLRLLLLAHHRNAFLTTDAEAQAIHDAIRASTAEDLEKRAIDTRFAVSTADINKGVFPLGKPLGAGTGRFVPIYRNDQGRIFIEYENVRGVLFEIDLSVFTSKVEAIPRLLIWEYNKHLVVLIPKMFALLGYVITIMTGGFGALVREILEDVVLATAGEVLEGLNLPGGDGGGLGAALALVKRRKIVAPTPKDVSNASKRLGRLGEDEAQRAAAKAARGGAEEASEELLKLGRRQPQPDPVAAFNANLARMRTPHSLRRNVEGESQPARTDPRLIEAVRQERAANTDLSPGSFESNVAAVRITVNGRPETLVAANSPIKLHSEVHLTVQIAEIRDAIKGKYGNAKVKVLEFFSEREPCYGSCRILLKGAFPDARVSFLIPDARTAGKYQWDVKELLGRYAEALRKAWLGGG